MSMSLREYFSRKPRGTATAMAKKIGAYSSDISDWANEERPIPAHYCKEIEDFTEGNVTRKILRPNDWQKYWPELAEGE